MVALVTFLLMKAPGVAGIIFAVQKLVQAYKKKVLFPQIPTIDDAPAEDDARETAVLKSLLSAHYDHVYLARSAPAARDRGQVTNDILIMTWLLAPVHLHSVSTC